MALSTAVATARPLHRSAQMGDNAYQGVLALDWANGQAIAPAGASVASAVFDATNADVAGAIGPICDRVVFVSVTATMWITVASLPSAVVGGPGNMVIIAGSPAVPVYVPAGMRAADAQLAEWRHRLVANAAGDRIAWVAQQRPRAIAAVAASPPKGLGSVDVAFAADEALIAQTPTVLRAFEYVVLLGSASSYQLPASNPGVKYVVIDDAGTAQSVHLAITAVQGQLMARRALRSTRTSKRDLHLGRDKMVHYLVAALIGLVLPHSASAQTVYGNQAILEVQAASGGQEITIADTDSGSPAVIGDANLLFTQTASLGEAATLESMSFYVTTAAGNLRLGMSDNTGPGGTPGNLIGQTASFLAANGWNTQSVTCLMSCFVPAGTYWLVCLSDSNSMLSNGPCPQSGTECYAPVTFGPMPSPYNGTCNTETAQRALYTTLLTGSPPAPTIGGVVLSNNTFTCGTAGTVGHITVSGTNNSAATLSKGNTHAGQFGLSSTTVPSDLTVGTSPAGCPRHYTVDLTATLAEAGGACGSPCTKTKDIAGNSSGGRSIQSIALSNAATTTGLPSGTEVGRLSVTLSPMTPVFAYASATWRPSTTGGCAGHGGQNGSFQVLNGDTLATNGSLTRGTKDVCFSVSAPGIASFSQPFTITVGTRIDAAAGSGSGGCVGDGTSGNPWNYLCVQNAVNSASTAGGIADTVFLRAGNWQLNTAPTDPDQVRIHGKTLNLVGAGSGNTFDTWGHINNSSGEVLCPTNFFSVTCVMSAGTSYPPGGGSTPNPAAHIVFGNTLTDGFTWDPGCVNINVAHIFFDTSRAENGDDAFLAIRWCPGPTLVQDIRFLAYRGTMSAETQFFPHISPSVTVSDSSIAEPRSSISSGLYGRNFLLEPVSGNGINMSNDTFFQLWPIPTNNSNAILRGTAIYMYNDGLARPSQDAYYGPTGTKMGGAHNVYCPEAPSSSGQCLGNTNIIASNNFFYSPGAPFAIGSGVNDPSTNGGLFNLSFTGNWIKGSIADIDACVWHPMDDQGNCNNGHNAMIVNALIDTNCNVSDNGTSFSITNNSLLGTSAAWLNASGTDTVTCYQGPNQNDGSVEIATRVYGFNAQKNYLSSPSNQYITNANTIGPVQTNNYCTPAAGTVTGCATTGFNTPPTVSFTLGPLANDPVKGGLIVLISNPSFTAQYGAVQWLTVNCPAPCSTPPATPLSSDSRWSSNNPNFPKATAGSPNGVVSASNSYIPPASLSGVSHGDAVYMWVMDSANHIAAATPQVVP